MLVGCAGGGGEATGPGQSADLPQGSEPVELDPADFTVEVDNRYWPMRPGTRWTYREVDEEGKELRVVVTVTAATKETRTGSRRASFATR